MVFAVILMFYDTMVVVLGDKMSEKSEAQIRNEEAVRKIMAERGYDRTPMKKKKQIDKAFGERTNIAPFITAFIIIGIVAGVWFLFKDNPFETKHYSSNDETSAELEQERANFKACLGSIDNSEIAIDDADFWNKNISRYEETISCYEKYPSVSSLATKIDLQNKLKELRENSEISATQDAEYKANLERINAEYEANMAKIDKELADNLAKIQKESDDWEQELLERTQERQVQREAIDADNKRKQDEYDAQQKSKKEAEEQAEQEKIARCAAYVGKTEEELADNDSDVKNAKNAYNNASSAYNKAFNDYKAALNVTNQSLRSAKKATMDEAKNTRDAAQLNYNNIRNSKLSYYSQILRSCN